MAGDLIFRLGADAVDHAVLPGCADEPQCPWGLGRWIRSPKAIMSCNAAPCLVALVGVVAAACTGPNPAYRRGELEAGTLDTGNADANPEVSVPPAPDSAAEDAPPAIAADGGVSPALANGLLGLWTMDESSQALVARDGSGNGHDGILDSFGPGQTWVAGRRGGSALQVPGATIRDVGVRVEATPAIQAIQSFTVAAWIYIVDDSLIDWRTIISRAVDATDNEIFNLSIVRGHVKILAASAPANQPAYAFSATSPQLAVKNRWLHVAATLGGGVLRVYEDGVETDNTGYAHPLPASNAPMYIGTNKNTPASGSEPFAGLIDDLLLWNVALSAAQIRDLAGGVLPPRAP